MELLHPHCAGLDLHKESVVACVRHMVDGKAATEVKSFQTTTQQLMELSDWLSSQAVTHIAMEATGVYWKPVWHILSDNEFVLVLANAAHVKNVPGRKTDVNDAMWLADLMAHGLIRASFVPDEPTQQMRDLLRTRKQFVRERSSHTQRIQKTLEDANIKLDSVITDIVGLSGRRMIEALIAGETDPEALAALADGRIRATKAELQAALRGRMTAHHRFMLRIHLDHLDALNTTIAAIDKEVERQRRTLSCSHRNVDHHPRRQLACGRSDRLRDRHRHEPFQDRRPSDQLGRTLPKNDESAGKRRSTRMKKGAPWLKTTLIQCAWAASRTKGSYLQAQYLRIRSRRGAKKAIGAVAASMLTAAYSMLKDGTLYQDLGANHFDNRDKGKQALRLLNRLKSLGFAVQITSMAA